jgi:hemolysin III
MSKREDEIASKAVRKSTLISLKQKKKIRLAQLKDDYEKSVQEINVQYAKDPERLKAKYAASNFAKSERAKKKAEQKIAKEKQLFEMNSKLRKYTLGEEIFSAIIQGVGFGLFIAATAILESIAIKSAESFITLTTTMYALFGSSMILMYLFSVLHHAITHSGAKEVFKRLSHVASFLIIGFAYTVYTLTKVQDVTGWILFGIVWALVLVGAIIYAIFGTKYEKLNIAFYFIAGWAGLTICKTLYEVLTAQSFKMLVLSGAFYLVGLIFYSLRKVKYMHVIGNIFMLAGSIYLFFSLFFINM